MSCQCGTFNNWYVNFQSVTLRIPEEYIGSFPTGVYLSSDAASTWRFWCNSAWFSCTSYVSSLLNRDSGFWTSAAGLYSLGRVNGNHSPSGVWLLALLYQKSKVFMSLDRMEVAPVWTSNAICFVFQGVWSCFIWIQSCWSGYIARVDRAPASCRPSPDQSGDSPNRREQASRWLSFYP
jgi:hypothetical protein